MISRRTLLKALSLLPLGGLAGGLSRDIPFSDPEEALWPERRSGRDYFKELGVRTFINAQGTFTSLSGSLMHPQVMDAINYTSTQYVEIEELQEKVGQRLADLCRCEHAMVTAGAASALTLGTAACITGKDQDKIREIPNLPGPKPEVILQRTHRFGYDHAIRNCGVDLVEVETREELENAINERTVCLFFLNYSAHQGEIGKEEFVELGKKHGIPTFNDAAADLPPASRLWEYNEMGFDLVTFSGGKGLRGPQSAGILMGRRDLIDAARLNHVPHADTIGRGMKVNKEEIVGMMVAIEEFIKMDEDQWQADKLGMTRHIASRVGRLQGVETEIFIPDIANHTPTLRIEWDEDRFPVDADEVRDRLRDGHPSIAVQSRGDWIRVSMWMARPGQERIVADRLYEVLDQARA